MVALKPKSICNYAGCGKTIDDKGYCDKHKEIAKKQADALKNRKPHEHSKLYNWQWKKVRANYLMLNPLCVECDKYGLLEPATVVDHIRPHKGNLDLFWNESNYQPLCKSCHDRKTATEDGGFGRVKNDVIDD